jgi:predicted dehydrogenase
LETVGWGVIGCSDIVERRAAAAIAAQEHSTLVAFHSRRRDRAAAFAARFGAAHADDELERFLARREMTAVYVATEVDRHAELAIAAATAGKHVLVEKPMALDVAQCRAMIAAAAEHGVALAVAYYARFFPKAAVMKRLIEQGALGTVVRANVRVIGSYQPAPDDPKAWRVTARGGGNQLADIGSHRLDLLAYFLGRPVRVCGFADRLTMPYEAADTETALVQFENGAHATVLANANAAPLPASPLDVTTMELYGTAGALLTDPWSEAPVEVLGTTQAPLPARRPDNAHAPLIDDFARAIVEGRPPRFTGLDGLWATAVIAGTYQSARTGRVVPIEGG